VEQQQLQNPESHSGEEVPVVGAENSNNKSPDPDDLRIVEINPLPAQAERWWSSLLLGPEGAAVCPQDACLVFEHITCRLGLRMSETPTPFSAITVGELHTAIEESYGKPGWTAFVQCWQEAAGIKQPERKSIRSDTDALNRIPEQTNPTVVSAQSTSFKSTTFDTEQPPMPPTPYDLDPAFARAIGTAPRKVAAFLLHVPRDPPAWRQKESESERSQREQLERIGGWPGG
jgi:hypothetical protein